jgi:hypothetical protein
VNRKDRLAERLRPDEIKPAFELVALLEQCGQMTPEEADEWRRRIEGWAKYHAVEAETPPNG